jgi:hypothetical protein
MLDEARDVIGDFIEQYSREWLIEGWIEVPMQTYSQRGRL